MDPESFAQRVIYEYDNAGINYLRWNGGGDLFDEAANAIEFIRVHRPDIVLWIVTRKPEIASQLKFHQNHYIHVSLDQTSYFKRAQIKSIVQYGMSKCTKGEKSTLCTCSFCKSATLKITN